MQSISAKADAHRITLQYIADCKAGATPALVRHARNVMVEAPRTEAQARSFGRKVQS